jgi:ATP-dependent Clp protease, protease subunit
MNIIPSVLYNGSGSPRVCDVFSRLLSDRAIMLGGPIDGDMSYSIVAQLLHLEAENPGADIQLYINSPGGSVTDALAIYDVMRCITSRVETICIGQACSAASLLLCSGDHRLMTENARILLHQPSGGLSGQAIEIKRHADEINKIYDIICNIYLKHTKIKSKQIRSILDRDSIFRWGDKETLEYGLVDGVVPLRKGSDNKKNDNSILSLSTGSEKNNE